MAYIDGFIVAVPTANKDIYRRHAAEALPIFKEFGVTRMVEGWGDEVPDGEITDLRRAVQAKDDETVVFSWFEYPDRATRDAANKKMMEDPRMEAMGAEMPFDGMRMDYGGFETILDEGAAAGATYIDGTIAPARADGKAACLAYSARMTTRLLELGALRCVDAWEDDIKDGKVTDHRRAVNAEPGEKIVYSWIEWPSKAVRDAAWPQIMADPQFAPSEAEAAAIDNRRRIYGGFVPVVDG